jgi:thioredoxin reductase
VAKTYDAEVVIIGGGWAGLIAAVTAGDAGLKTVVLEKQAMIGGGMFLPGATNSGQTPDGKSLDELYQQYMEVYNQNSVSVVFLKKVTVTMGSKKRIFILRGIIGIFL